MSDSITQFEIKDSIGTTDTFAGTVTATPISLPPVAGNPIDQIGIRNAIDQPFNARLEFSYDNVNWIRLGVGEAREDELRGGITQIRLRAAGPLSTCNYEVIMNRGPA